MRLLSCRQRSHVEAFCEFESTLAIRKCIEEQSMYATARPGPGLRSERSHTAGEKIHSAAFGCVREVFALNGHSTVRLRPSDPTASLILRILSRACRSWRRDSNSGNA